MATGKPVSVNELIDVPWLNSLVISVFDTTLSGATGLIDTGAVLPTSYAHLLVKLADARGDNAATNINVQMRLNNDTGANYYLQRLRGNGATASAVESLAQTSMVVGFLPAASAVAGLGGSIWVSIPGYSTGSLAKGIHTSSSCPTGTATGTIFVDETAGFWNSGATINRVALLASAGNFIAGTRMTVYAWGAG